MNPSVHAQPVAAPGTDEPVTVVITRRVKAGREADYEAWLARLQAAPTPSYKARFDDLRGDVLAAQGKKAEARAAWQAAIDSLAAEGEDAVTLREVVRVKLESLGA